MAATDYTNKQEGSSDGLTGIRVLVETYWMGEGTWIGRVAYAVSNWRGEEVVRCKHGAAY